MSSHNDNDGQALGPLQAIWRRIAYVTVEQLLREEFAGHPHPLPDDAADLIAVGLRPAARVYVLTAMSLMVLAGSGGITMPALVACLSREALIKAARIDQSTGQRLTETIRQQFPTIFSQPLTVGVDDRQYEISFSQDRFLARTVT